MASTGEIRAFSTEPSSAERYFSEPARRILDLSARKRGRDREIQIVGFAPRLVEMLRKLEKFARYDEPVLIHGESGVGKESVAEAIHLLGSRTDRPYVAVNCPQYQEGNLTVSELFGHRKGSFTGAASDRKGCFETADGGVIFLDEIGDLNMEAQMMLLRTISTGEYKPLGSETVRRANVRIVSATNRPLNQLVLTENFRKDLFFRLRYFLLEPPPLRDRGDDWSLLVDFCLARLHHRYGIAKRLSDASMRLLGEYPWPGNVRELIGVVTSGYALSDAELIEPSDFVDRLEQERGSATSSMVDELYRKLTKQSGDFWELVHDPFLDRDLSRREVRSVVARGLSEAGNYRRLLEIWRIPADGYHRFMGFLKNHRLKPKSFSDESS